MLNEPEKCFGRNNSTIQTDTIAKEFEHINIDEFALIYSSFRNFQIQSWGTTL
jgi:hypothetical protein